jgi:hypothetical protein
MIIAIAINFINQLSKRRISKAATALLVLFCFISQSYATTYYNKSSGTGALQTLSNWGTNSDGSGTVPGSFTSSGDVFDLYNGSTATITAAWVITGVTLNVGNGSAAMNLTIPSGYSLTGTGTVNVSAAATLTLQNTTNPLLGTLNATSTVNYNGTGAQTIALATYGNLALSGARTGSPAITLPSGTINVSGNFTVSYTGTATFSSSGNSFNYTSLSGGQTVGGITYQTLNVNNTSGTNTAGGAIAVSGTLNTTSGGILDMSTYALTSVATVNNNGTIQTECTTTTPIPSGKTWAGTISYNAATGGQTVVAGTYTMLNIGNTSGTTSAGGAIVVNNTLTTATGGTLSMGSTYTLSGSLSSITNNGNISTSVLTSTSSSPLATSKVWGGSGTVTYSATTGAQTVVTGTYNNLNLSNTSGTNTAGGTITVNGILTTTSGGTFAMSTYQLLGSFSPTNNGTITTASTANPPFPSGLSWLGTTGVVNLAATGGGQFIPAGTYKTLTLSNTSGTNTAVGAPTITTGLTTTSGGTLSMSTYQLTGAFAVTNNGTITTACLTDPAIPASLNWSGTTGVVTFNAVTGAQNIPAGTYQTLNITNTSGSDSAVGNLSVSTLLSTTSGGTLDLTTYTLSGTLTTLTNNGTINTQNTSSAPIPSGKTIGGTVNYNAAAGGQTIVAETSYTNLVCGNSGGTNTAGGALAVTTALTVNAGATLEMGTYALSGAFSVTNNGSIQTECLSSNPVPAGKTWGGTFLYLSISGGQTIAGGTYTNLGLGNGLGTNTAGGSLVVNNFLLTSAGGTLNMTAAYTLTGTLSTVANNGTISTLVPTSTSSTPFATGVTWGGTGTITYAATAGSQTIVSGTYYNLSMSNTSGTNSAGGTITINNSLTTTSGGTFAMGIYQLLGNVLGITVTNNGTITTTSTISPAIPAGATWSGTTGVVNFANTSGGQYIPAGTFKTLICSNTANSNTATGNISVSTGLTTTSGGTLAMSTYQLSGGATITNNGTITTNCTSNPALPSGDTWSGTTGVVTFLQTAGGQYIPAGTYKTLNLSNTSGADTAVGNLSISALLNISTGGSLNMSTYTLGGTLTTLTYTGTIYTQNTSSTPLPTGRALTGTINYNAATGGQTVVSETSYNNLTIGNTSGTNTAAANTVVNGTLNTNGGIFDLSTYTLSGTLSSITGTGTIRTANTSTTPIKVSQNWPQTIEYYTAAGSQTIVSGTYTGGLTNSNTSGTNTVASGATISIPGNLTLNAGSLLSDNGVAISLAGNINGTGTHTGSGSITMTGSGATISGATLKNLKLNNSGGFSTTANPTINGTLTLLSGTLNIGTDTLAFGTSATAAGTFSSSNMIIANGGGLVTTANSGGYFFFPIGDNSANYTPIALTFTAGTYTGSNPFAGVNVTNTEHPQNANTTNYINRYWSVVLSGITSPVYTVAATYVTGDIVGTEANISMGQYPGALPWIKYGSTNVSTNTLTATGVTNLTSDFTGINSINPTVSASSSSPAICNGGSTVLSAAGTGDPSLTYTWSPATGLSATTGSSVTATRTSTVTVSYTYTVTVTDGNGFKSTDTSILTINPLPSLSGASNSGIICSGATLSLYANSPVNVSGYSWAGPVSITSSTSATATVPSATTAASGTYTVTVSNGGAGCTASYTTTATVNATPTARPTNNSAICLGGTVTLTANPNGGATVFAWSGPNLSSTTAQNPTAVPTVTVTYSLTATNGTTYPGCVTGNVYTTTVTVNPVPTAAPTNSGTSCSGSSITLTANPASGAAAYTWSGPNLASTTAQNPTATPTVTATYSLTVTDGSGHSGCSPSTVYTTTVTVRPTGYWLAATSRVWGDASNWCGGVPSTTTNVVIPTGSTYNPLISTGTAYANNLTIQSGTSLTDSGGTLQIAGTISNSGTFYASNGTVVMNGSSAQTIPASTFATNTVKNLTINNSAGVTLGGTLNISGILLASSGAFASGGYLTLLSTSAQTALIDGSGSGSVTGTVYMQRYIDTAFGYTYLSSPFTAAKLGQLSAYLNLHDTTFPTVYRYLENDSTNGYVVDTTSTDTMKVMQGYACNFGTSLSPKTVSLYGVVNNGTLSYTLYNHNKTYTLGYNLIGNPYPSPIDWNASSGWTKTNIDNALYYFNSSDSNRYSGTYSSYVSGVSSDGIASNVIASMQGFFIHVSNGTYPVTGTLSMTNSVRTTALSPAFHRETAGSARTLVRLSAGFNDDGSHSDPTVIYFDDSATNTFNNNLDALKLINTDVTVPSVYSFSQDNNRLSIFALPTSIDSSTLIPLGLQTSTGGYVTFNARDIENLPIGMHLYFYDTKTGVSQDIETTPKYKIFLNAGKYENRFFLLFTTKDKVVIPGYNSELNAYTDGKNIFAYLTTANGQLVVTDVLGRMITKQTLDGTGYHEVDLDVAPGIYFATLYSGMGKQTKKLFIGK